MKIKRKNGRKLSDIFPSPKILITGNYRYYFLLHPDQRYSIIPHPFLRSIANLQKSLQKWKWNEKIDANYPIYFHPWNLNYWQLQILLSTPSRSKIFHHPPPFFSLQSIANLQKPLQKWKWNEKKLPSLRLNGRKLHFHTKHPLKS